MKDLKKMSASAIIKEITSLEPTVKGLRNRREKDLADVGEKRLDELREELKKRPNIGANIIKKGVRSF